MRQSEIHAYLSKIGTKGGKISRRDLTPEEARAMQAKSVASRKKNIRDKKSRTKQ